MEADGKREREAALVRRRGMSSAARERLRDMLDREEWWAYDREGNVIRGTPAQIRAQTNGRQGK